MAFISTRATAGLAALGAALVAFAAQAGTLETVKQRGALVCGVSEGLGGFSDRDATGAWSGFDVDFCRAVAAAVLGDPQKAQFVPLSTTERFDALRAGKVDVLSRNSTWTFEREAGQGILFAGVDYHDGQAFMVVRHPTVTSALELGGVSVCVQDGTTTRANLADFFKANSMTYTEVIVAGPSEAIAKLESGGCDAYTTDQSALYVVRLGLKKPSAATILPDVISKEPLGPGGARRRRRLVQRRQMDALRADQRRGARGREIDARRGAAVAEAGGAAAARRRGRFRRAASG